MDDTSQTGQQDQGQQPQARGSPPVKEQEPRSVGAEQAGTEELVKPTEEAPTVPKEVAEVGVEKTKQAPDLTLEDQKAGLSLAKESTEVSTQPSGVVKLPLTEEEEREAERLSPQFSRRWLAKLQAKVSEWLRLVHGKIMQ